MAHLRAMTGAVDTGRYVRAAGFGASSVCLALAAHVATGGPRPSLALIVVAAVLLSRMSFGLTGRERSLATAAAAMLTAQLFLHVVFVLAAHHGPAAGPADPAGLPSAAAGGGVGGAGEGAAGHLLAVLRPDPAMAAGHALAALCVAVALHRCERRLWSTATLRAAVDRATAVVGALLLPLLARLRQAARQVLLSTAGAFPLDAAGAVGAAGGLGRVGGRNGPASRWCPHLSLLGTDAGWRGPPSA